MARLALITGGTRGIGKAIAIRLKKSGYQVIVSCLGNNPTTNLFFEETNIPVYKFDVSDFEAVREGITLIESEHGPIDVLVNNAGITRDSAAHKMTFDMFSEVINTNLTGAFNVSNMVLPSMRTQGFGRIINISSVNGLSGQFGQANYAASKAGVIGMTKSLALENASKGITVNAIAPGYTDTEMVRAVPEKILESIISQIPVGRLGKPDEIARAVEFLCSDDSSFITGSTLSINGGQYLS